MLLHLRIIIHLRASLGTTIFQRVFIFPWENKLISLGKIEIPWEIVVPKLAFKVVYLG
jgi:hypothetical protein